MGTEEIVKTEEGVTAEAPSAIEQKIIQQIEYYFGNYNLSRDKFLKEQVALDDGWVPLETMVKFNRLKKISEDFNVIIEALKKSPNQLMEVSDDGKKIRRRIAAPLPEDYQKRTEGLDARTVYVKGFKKTNTLDDLLEFFKGHHVEHVFMRRRNNLQKKPFKGSVCATFETRDHAQKFMDIKGLKYGGTELLREWKADYMKRKDECYKTWREEKEKKALKKAEGGNEEQKKNGEKIKVPELTMIPGCLLKLTNLDENITREHIKEIFDSLGTLVYVDYSKGKPSAVLRFETGEAKDVFEKVEKVSGETDKVKIESCVATISIIEGEEEEKYWKSIAERRAESRLRMKGYKNFGNKKKFGARRWNERQKRKNDNEDEADKDGESVEPSPKKAKVEDSGEKAQEGSSAMEVTSETNNCDKKEEKVSSETTASKDEAPESKKLKSES